MMHRKIIAIGRVFGWILLSHSFAAFGEEGVENVVDAETEIERLRAASVQEAQERRTLIETLVAERLAHKQEQENALAALAAERSMRAEQEGRDTAMRVELEAKIASEVQAVESLKVELQAWQDKIVSLGAETQERILALELERDELLVLLAQMQAQVKERDALLGIREAEWTQARDHLVARYEASKEQALAERESILAEATRAQTQERVLLRELREQVASNVRALSLAADQLMAMENEVSRRDAEIAELEDQLTDSRYARALLEISAMETELSRMGAARMAEVEQFQAQVRALEVRMSETAARLDASHVALQEEQVLRRELEEELSRRPPARTGGSRWMFWRRSSK
jgi:hypothetical protein